MESIMARALEYTLKYWLKSFSRDQFKLQGRTCQLSNIDISGEALHASLGLPTALIVTMAKSGKLEIVLPYLSNVQVEPIIVHMDKLDVVLEETDDLNARRSMSSAQAALSSSKGGSYGFAEKIADGMTLQIQTVNLLLETHGGGRHLRGTMWASPMASITIRNLVLYTTNENWKVVNLKAAREFSSDKNYIYVFRKLEWEYLCIDLLPHPDMFANVSEDASSQKDDDGAKRAFFGGERFIDGISGEAYITIQRTGHNWPLGLEVQVHITEAICQALSEPGLRAVLRFFMGLYVCLNREDVTQQSAEAAGNTLVSFIVDHIFLGIKDAGFQLELLLQSVLFSRACVSDGEIAKYLTRIMIGGLILRDTFSQPPCPLVQPSMQDTAEEHLQIPDFGKNFCPPIYPLGDQQWRPNESVPLISLHSLQFMPSLAPPSLSSQTVIDCKPLMIDLQEESCLRISSFLTDGVALNPEDTSPDFTINSFQFTVKELEITVPLEFKNPDHPTCHDHPKYSSFRGAKLHITNFYFSESPYLRLGLLNLDMDAACFSMWEGQPIDNSQKKWAIGASLLGLSLEKSNNVTVANDSGLHSSELWRCVEMKGVCIQVAMITSDGSPLKTIPPPEGVVRVGVSCDQYMSNTSVEQLFFVLDLYAYIDNVNDRMAKVGKNKHMPITNNGSSNEKVPADTGISLVLENLKLTLLESSSLDIQGTPLVQFIGDDLSMQVTHRTLGAAMAISSTLRWDGVQVDCAEASTSLAPASDVVPSVPELRAVFWVQNRNSFRSNRNAASIPFLNLSIVHVVPYDAQDIKCHSLRVSACIAGVRLAGGMNYYEALLHRFGVLGPDGGPGAGLTKGLERLSSGPMSKLFKTAPPFVNEVRESQNDNKEDDKNSSYIPDDVNISLELKDWLFALESADVMAEMPRSNDMEDSYLEKKTWHTSFESFKVKANGSKTDCAKSKGSSIVTQKYPVEVVRVGVEGLKALKPQQKGNTPKKTVEPHCGIDLEVDIVPSEDNDANGMMTWAVENLKVSAKQPIEIVVRKDELQHVTHLFKLEVDSMGQVAVGILRLLKLDKSVGQPALDQLRHLGSEGFEEIFSPRNLSTDTKSPSIARGQSSLASPHIQRRSSFDSTLSSLEEALLDSQSNCATLSAELTNCATLSAELNTSESSKPHVHNIEQLAQRLESMKELLMKLRTQPSLNISSHKPYTVKCTSSTPPELPDFPSSDSSTTTSQETFPIEKRRKSEILRDRKSKSSLVKSEPPNFEIGWKRTVPIPLEKPVGYVIMDFLEKLEELMDKEYGSTDLLAKVGEIVSERAREVAEELRDEGKVEDRMVTELFRVLKLLEMDLVMVKSAVKEETLKERLSQAKARCRQAILVANSF
nr:hypothetical protein [Tanacetum cinerariifolium]